MKKIIIVFGVFFALTQMAFACDSHHGQAKTKTKTQQTQDVNKA